MKFSDFDAVVWDENSQYYDTCLIPLTGLTGAESPPVTVAALERLRDFMDLVEKPYCGRIVTYPVFQYIGEHSLKLINEICRNVKSVNFKYVVVLTADLEIVKNDIVESDLILSRPLLMGSSNTVAQALIAEKIGELWQKGNSDANVSI